MTDERLKSWRTLITSTTLVGRVIAGVLVTGYIAQFIPGFRWTFALVAGRTIPKFWNIFTSGLLETRLVTMTFNVMAVLILSKHIEPVYGSKPYLKFLAIVLSCSGLCAFISVYLAYALDRNESSKLLFTEICGFHGVTAGMLVAVKQILPDSEVSIFKVPKLRVKHLASLYIVTACVISLVSKRIIATMPFVFGGTYSAWFYLRFLQPSSSDASQKGDNSPDFSFASFYPRPVQPFIDKMAGLAGRLVRLSHPAPLSVTSTGPNAAPAAQSAEANRRRERGQRALEERLGKSANSTDPNKPTGQMTDLVRDIETGHRDGSTPITGVSEADEITPQNSER